MIEYLLTKPNGPTFSAQRLNIWLPVPTSSQMFLLIFFVHQHMKGFLKYFFFTNEIQGNSRVRWWIFLKSKISKEEAFSYSLGFFQNVPFKSTLRFGRVRMICCLISNVDFAFFLASYDIFSSSGWLFWWQLLLIFNQMYCVPYVLGNSV